MGVNMQHSPADHAPDDASPDFLSFSHSSGWRPSFLARPWSSKVRYHTLVLVQIRSTHSLLHVLMRLLSLGMTLDLACLRRNNVLEGPCQIMLPPSPPGRGPQKHHPGSLPTPECGGSCVLLSRTRYPLQLAQRKGIASLARPQPPHSCPLERMILISEARALGCFSRNDTAMVPSPPDGGLGTRRRIRHWHLARLFLSSTFASRIRPLLLVAWIHQMFVHTALYQQPGQTAASTIPHEVCTSRSNMYKCSDSGMSSRPLRL
ncbi:hypothetical protein J3F83DRAFT_36974 [Trichoderma novae-zelandiae]